MLNLVLILIALVLTLHLVDEVIAYIKERRKNSAEFR